ncbi:hypothetical protein BLNAU_13783 [Blattamonas nauphoetae]|uniref:Uncharacterized protein n=1 Tax=Blattamonas nauphoetae TaxID=2049346 RepID=A0ABQ9XM05_9EUKA|nr:hypothetical protein BLNAU_13783 [Blattamonas nauphoetae]
MEQMLPCTGSRAPNPQSGKMTQHTQQREHQHTHRERDDQHRARRVGNDSLWPLPGSVRRQKQKTKFAWKWRLIFVCLFCHPKNQQKPTLAYQQKPDNIQQDIKFEDEIMVVDPTTAYFGKHNSDSHAGLERGEGRGRDKGGVREVGKEVEGEKGGGRVTTEGGREEANDCVPTDDNDTLFAVFAPPTKSETLRIHNRRSSMNVEERHDEEELR